MSKLNNINVAKNVAQRNSQDLTEQWKNGELEEGEYYIKSNKGDIYIDICADGSFMFTNYRSIEEVLGEVPEYTIWKNYVNGYCEEHEYNLKLIKENKQLNELLDSMQDTNKLLAHKLQPFTDPYFRGLTTKDISELAKKSIRLTTQHCEDNERIEKLEEENQNLRHFCEEFNALNVAQENQKLKELIKECGKGLEKIKHIAEVKNLAAVYQVAERTLARLDEVLK